MKKITFVFLLSIVFFTSISGTAQTINWVSLQEEHKQLINAHFGLEHGIIYGAGYSRMLHYRIPVVLHLDCSVPSGKKILDDSKTKIGGSIRWISFKNFQFSTGAHVIFRRYKSDLVRLVNFGSDVSGTLGYYRPKWFVAGEFGLDNAIATHFKHSKMYKENYAAAVDGWYAPFTGGNFYYGLQTGISFNKHDLYLKAGRMVTTDFKTSPLLPFYAELGYNFKFK